VPFALASAVLFGASTPSAKLLLGTVDPWLMAGLLYLGAVLAVVALGEPLSVRMLAAGGLMSLGLRLHLAERHKHEPMEHEHRHVHDEHHRHTHSPGDRRASHTPTATSRSCTSPALSRLPPPARTLTRLSRNRLPEVSNEAVV
jgi:hypothetical protein